MPGEDHVERDEEQEDAARDAQRRKTDAEPAQQVMTEQCDGDQDGGCDEHRLHRHPPPFLRRQPRGHGRIERGHVDRPDRREECGESENARRDHGVKVERNPGAPPSPFRSSATRAKAE